MVKVTILLEILIMSEEGKLDLSQRVPLVESNKVIGSGILKFMSEGLQPTILDLVKLMIIVSDNTATNFLVSSIPGKGLTINERMKSLGLDLHFVADGMIPVIEPNETQTEFSDKFANFRYSEGSVDSLARFYQMLFDGKLLKPETTKLALEVLGMQQHVNRIPVRYMSRAELGQKYIWQGKTGTLEGWIQDSGILSLEKGDFLLVFMTKNVAYKEPHGMVQMNFDIGAMSYYLVTNFEEQLT